MEKKYVTFLILAIVLGASGLGNISLAIRSSIVELEPPPRPQDLVYGTDRDIVYLDPVYACDSGSLAVIDQVVERLYWFNVSDPACPAVPALATAYPTITPDGLEYTIPLRTNVTFHDNTTMDATAVKWNFDRLMWFCNYSGNKYLPTPFNVSLPIALPSGIPTPTQLWGAIYMNPDGTPILNETVVINPTTIKFILNQPRAAWLSHLAFVGSSIMSPASTPANDYIQLHEDLIGTGPFLYRNYTAGVEIKFDPNPDYWQGPTQLTSLTFAIFPSLTALNQALLSGDIDILTAMDPAYIDQHDADPDIHLEYAGGTLTTSFVTFNYDLIPLAMRKSVAYCLNYTYIIDVVYEGVAVRWPTYIPMGIAYANYTLDYPTFNRTKAREILLNDAYYGPILATALIDENSPDSAWTTLADGPTPIEHYNYSWVLGKDFWHDTGDRLAFDMRYIGVQMDVNGMGLGDWVDLIVEDRHRLGLYMLEWKMDYMDPENYINPLWGNQSRLNGGNYYEPDVQALMDAGMVETDLVIRRQIYDEIQKLMVERDFPSLTLTTGLNYDAWKNEVVGFSSNPLGNVWFYLCERVYILPNIIINSPTTNQFFGGNTPDYNVEIYGQNLDTFWYTIDGGAENYTFTATIGNINQTAWNSLLSGTVIIRFYVNNTYGDIGYATVSVIKDIDAPTSYLLFTPHSGTNIVNKSTTFILTANDSFGSGISVIKYKINDSAWIDYFGQFDFYSYEYGDYLISHQAIDVAGNIEVVKTVLVTLVEIPSEPIIPGYNIILLIGVICLVSMILYKKRHKV